MADTTRQIQGGVQPFVVGDKSFRGIDTYTDPNKLENGFAETIDGLIVDGGSLVLRNGFHGQLPNSYMQTSSTSAGIYEMTPVKGQGTNAGHFIFTQGGNVYAFNATSKQQVALSTNFNAYPYNMYSPNVRMTTFGKYIYGVPGLQSDSSQSTMPMFRVNTAQFMPITLSASGSDMLVTLSSPYNTYFVENGSPIRIRLVTGSLPSSISPSVTYYVRDFVMGAATSTFKLSSTLTGSRVAFSTIPGSSTYDLIWMAELLPSITGYPNLSPLARPNLLNAWAVPPVMQNYFIDESVGPTLITETGGGALNLIINGTFKDFGTSSNAAIPSTVSATRGWAPLVASSILAMDKTFAPTNNYYVGNATNVVDATVTNGLATNWSVQIDGATDAIYQDIPTTGGTPRIPREQVNYVDQRQTGNLFEGTVGGVNTTITFTNGTTTVNGTFTSTATFPAYTPVTLSTTGVLPTGTVNGVAVTINTTTTYYILGSTTSSVTLGLSADATSSIIWNTSGSSGTHTLISVPGVVVSISPHGLTVGQKLLFTTAPGSGQQGGITSGTETFVLTTPTNKTFTVSTTPTGSVLTFTSGGIVGYRTIQPVGQYLLTFWALNLDDQNSKTGQSILAFVKGADVSGVEISGAYTSQVIAPPIAKSTNDWVKYSMLIDFRVYQNILGNIRIQFQNINAKQGNSKGIYLATVECYAVSPRLGTSSTDLFDKNTGLLKIKAIQNSTNVRGYAGLLKGCTIKLSLGRQDVVTFANGTSTVTDVTNTSLLYSSGYQMRLITSGSLPTGFTTGTTYFPTATGNNTFQLRSTENVGASSAISASSTDTGTHYALVSYNNDWSKSETISIKMVFPEKLQASIPQIRLGVQERNSTSTSYDYIEWGGFGQYDIDNGYMTWSVRGFGKTRLDSIRQIYLRFETDIEGIQSLDDICYVGDLVTNGNLTAGSKYAYRYTLWYPKDGITAPFIPAVTGTNTTVTFSGTSVSGTFKGTSAYPIGTAVQFSTTGALPSPLAVSTTYYVISSSSTTLTVSSSYGGSVITFSGSGTGTHFIIGVASINYLGFESEPTKVTGELTATEALSSNQIVLNPNGEVIVPGSQAYTHFIIYRRSTSFPDGLYRCIGSVPTDMSTTLGSNLSIKSTTDSKYVLIDNVPEMDVLDDGPKGSQGDVYELGQDFFPKGATTCVVHQSRLWVGNKNTVWVSWFHNIDNEYTINTTHVPLLTDPKVSIKGASFDVSSPYDTEHITGFLPYHGDMMSRNNSTSAVMLVFRENTVYPVTGFDPSNWNIQGFLSEPGIGCIAKRATGTVLGQPWWLNNTGLVQFAGTKVIPVAIQLDGLLSYKPYKVSTTTSSTTNLSISLADYKNTLMAIHDKRVWLFGPSATYGSFTGVTGARTAYVFDTRIQAWSTISMPNIIGSGGDITGACSIPSNTDTESLYIGAANGQIYQYKDYFDSPFEITPVSISTSSSRVNITSSDWAALSPYDGATIIITSGNAQFATNTTWSITLSASGGNYFQMRPVGGGTAITLTSSVVFSFRPAVPIDWLYNSRLYGQTYSEGVSYYSRNRPHQLDLHIDTDTGGSQISWQLVGANVNRDGTNTVQASDSAMFNPNQYTFKGNTSRALRGIPTYLKDINWQVILFGSDAFYPFRIYGAHLHMIESGITRHR